MQSGVHWHTPALQVAGALQAQSAQLEHVSPGSHWPLPQTTGAGQAPQSPGQVMQVSPAAVSQRLLPQRFVGQLAG